MGQIVGTSDREASASDSRNDHLDRLIHEILKVPNGGDRDESGHIIPCRSKRTDKPFLLISIIIAFAIMKFSDRAMY